MRVSTFQVHAQASRQLQALGAQTAASQAQISTGKRINRPGDDPIGAARVVRLSQEIAAREQYIKNAQRADGALERTETVFGRVIDVIHRVQELALEAGSGVKTPADLQFLASEVNARFEELLALGNSRGANGEYLFSGFQGDVEPFVVGEEEVTYQGDAGERLVQIGAVQNVQISDAGAAVFVNVDAYQTALRVVENQSLGLQVAGVDIQEQELLDAFAPDRLVIDFSDNSGQMQYTVRRGSDQRVVEGLENIAYTGSDQLNIAGVTISISGSAVAGDRLELSTQTQQSVFQTVRNLAEQLANVTDVSDPAEMSAVIDATIANLDNAHSVVLRARADIGARFGVIESAIAQHEDVNLQLQGLRSQEEDLDFAQAVSDLAYQSFVLEAAQQSFVRINNLSLFNRL